MKLATADQMRELDRLTIEEAKIPGLLLMENAGGGAARLIIERFGAEIEDGVAIFCGPGNNGGDGFVIGRHLFNNGFDVNLYLLGPRNALKGDARTNRQIAENIGLPITEIKKSADLDKIAAVLERTGLVVDALFGTGLARAIEGLAAEIIELINTVDLPVVAVDIPSGLSADTGRPLGPVVAADFTATFGLAKVGQFLYPGADYCGEVEVVDISIPASVMDKVEIPTRLISPADVAPFFLPREPEAHKGHFGHALVIAGSTGMSGAAIMTANAALKSGAGLVTAAVPQPLLPIMEASLIEVMKAGLSADTDGRFSAAALEPALKLIKGKKAVALGPGIGLTENVSKFVALLVKKCPTSMVIDADGLNALAGNIDALAQAASKIVLTPHPGEMARLLEIDSQDVQQNRIGCAADLARRIQQVVVLKGARTVVAAPDGRIWINPTGNPGMASGGMGDVLTGMIVGFMAQSLDPVDAAVCGVFLHGLAGDVARQKTGEHALTATDVLEALPSVLRLMEKILDPDLPETEDCYCSDD